jgi:magnesium transporter
MTDDPLHIIRAVKDAVREMSSRVKGFVKSIARVLDEDEDMALMNLSRLLTHPERFIQPVPQEVLEAESDEPELILEAHLQTAFTLTNSLDLIQGQIDTAAELVDQKLDAVRNRLLFANMVISILSLCIACASLVGSVFGMNLKNHFEEDPNAFRQVSVGTAAGTVFMAGLIMFLLRSFLHTAPTPYGFSSGNE